MNFMFLMMALSLLTWAGTVSAADDCYSLDADDNTWVEVLVQKDWANELLEYLEENYASLEKSEVWYFVEQSETYYETEEEMMEYTEFRSIALDDQDVDWFEKKISAQPCLFFIVNSLLLCADPINLKLDFLICE